MEVKWKFRGRTLSKPPPEAFGFVYKITFNDGTFYIGSKQLNFYRKKLLTKREKKLPEFKRKKYKIVVFESDWIKYTSSSKLVQGRVTQENCLFEVIKFHQSKQTMLQHEAFLILKAFLSEDINILNEWVSIRTIKQYGRN